MVEGLCYGGVWGIKAVASSYTACAVLTLRLGEVTEGQLVPKASRSADVCCVAARARQREQSETCTEIVRALPSSDLPGGSPL